MPWLLLAVAVVPVLAGWRFAVRPVTPARIAAFARRHRRELTPGDEPFVAAYLAHTRRWRTAGALGGYLAGLVAALPQERVALQFSPVLAGWFAGAVVAEFRFRSVPQPGLRAAPAVPAWVLHVPQALAVTALGSTALVLALGRAGEEYGPVLALGRAGEAYGPVPAWGAAALACAATVALVDRHVADRPLHAIGAVTAIGSALAVSCLARQLAVVQDRFFDAAGAAVTGIVLLWTFGGLVIAWCIAVAAWRGGPGRRPEPALLVVATLVAVTGGWAGLAWWKDRAPYSAAAVQARATLRFTDFERFDRDARALGIAGLNGLVDQPDQRQFLGRVDLTTPPGAPAGCTYHLIVIGERSNRVATQLYDRDGGGWSSQLSTLADRYPWLSATAPTVSTAGYTYAGASVSAEAGSPGPLSFVGSLPAAAAGSPSDLLVALVLTGPDEQIYWATRVSG